MKSLRKLLWGDWELYEITQGKWNISNDFGDYSRFCRFKVEYSKSRKKYRLRCSGYRPKEHSLYSVCLNDVLRKNRNNELYNG